MNADSPGCFPAGDSRDEAMTGAEAAAWIDATLDAGAIVPAQSSLAAIHGDPACSGWTFGVTRSIRRC